MQKKQNKPHASKIQATARNKNVRLDHLNSFLFYLCVVLFFLGIFLEFLQFD